MQNVAFPDSNLADDREQRALWCSQGKPQQARELLAPVYGWLTEVRYARPEGGQGRCSTGWGS